MASLVSSPIPQSKASAKEIALRKLTFNVDAVAVGLALALAALVRLNVLSHIGW